jgi:hypothetical protein
VATFVFDETGIGITIANFGTFTILVVVYLPAAVWVKSFIMLFDFVYEGLYPNCITKRF